MLLWVPFLTLFLFGAWFRSAPFRGAGREPVLYLAASCLTVLIYLPLLGWLATFLGLWSRNRLTAFMIFLACVIVWSSPPLIAAAGGPAGGGLDGAAPDVPGTLLLLSPLTMVLTLESSIERRGRPILFSWWAAALNAVIHGGILCGVRSACLRGAEKRLHAT